MLRLRVLASAAVAVLEVAASARAAEEGPYAGLRVGRAVAADLAVQSPSVSLELDGGVRWSVDGALGYRFWPAFRSELSIGYLSARYAGRYRENVVSIPCGEVPSVPCIGAGVDADTEAWSAFAMGYFDLPVTERLGAYAGAGPGLIREAREVRTTTLMNNGTSQPRTLLDGRDTELALRFGAGVIYRLGASEVDVGYSFTRAGKPEFTARGIGVQSFTFDSRLKSHVVAAGVRMAF
jgi:opacity protein-like surface antigen